MKMRITDGKGIHYQFDNGLTLSVQIGGGNYSDNYNQPIGAAYRNPDYQLPPSETAEIAGWDFTGTWIKWAVAESLDHDVLGYIQLRVIHQQLIPFLMAQPDGIKSVDLIIPPELYGALQ